MRISCADGTTMNSTALKPRQRGRCRSAQVRAATVLVALALLVACGPSEDTPYLEFAGGGFIFNYRVGEAFYGFVVKTRRRLPDGSVIEARFENPAGGLPYIVRQNTSSGRRDYSFRTPALHGVMKDRDYKVTVLLRRSTSGPVIAQYSRSFRSSLSQAVIPSSKPGTQHCLPSKAAGRYADCIRGR